MNRVCKYVSRLPVILAVFLMIFCMNADSALAAASDFENLIGAERSGKVNISVESYQEKDGALYKTPKLVLIKAGDKTSYIPVITNLGSECNLRLRVYAKTETRSINILRYCYGWEDNWIFKDGWFYYRKPFEERESVEICRGFDFPNEWKWRVENVMDVTVEAEAVADEHPADGIIRTGDDSRMGLWIAAGLISFAIIIAAGRRKYGAKDI